MKILFFLSFYFYLIKNSNYFLGSDYSWDLDHEMYFGNRLYYKELIYKFEYNDKLPIVQYLFYTEFLKILISGFYLV